MIKSTPILEYLSLTNCQRSADLAVYRYCGSRMKTLKIHESDQGSSNSMLSIGCRIASLELVTTMSRKYYFLSGILSLESASFLVVTK